MRTLGWLRALVVASCVTSFYISDVLALPEQVIPTYSETGAPAFAPSGGTFSPGQGATDPSQSPGQNGTAGGPDGFSPGGNAYTQLEAQSYGQTAINTAQSLGVNPNTVAAIGLAESGFRNVPTANGTSSATGPWQVTSGTWDYFVNKYNLPYTSADRTNTEAQAVIAPYIIRDYAQTVQQTTGSNPTGSQVYGAFMYGPTPGGRIAAASPDTPMSAFVSPSALANNRMSGWTVGQFNQFASTRLGEAGSQKVF